MDWCGVRIERSDSAGWGGRKTITEIYPGIETALLGLVKASTQGDPESPLLWTNKSLAHLAEALTAQGMPVSPQTVSRLLAAHHYSIQAVRAGVRASGSRPAIHLYRRTSPSVSIGRQPHDFYRRKKRQELIGNDKNNGKEYHPVKQSVDVNGHDFPDPKVPKATPYGVYDPVRNTGWVNVGTDHDTGTFAVESIRQWWLNMGQEAYTNATELFITADGGGSNGSRLRLFKRELQKFADETPLAITVSHDPPGTSKFNKIEHRLFSAISIHWRGSPWINDETVVNPTRHTTTKTGRKVQAALDTGTYETGIVVKDKELAALNIERPEGQNQQWNYTIRPGVKTSETEIAC